MSYVLMYVSMTPRQEQTLRALENVTPRLATFHGYEQPGSERECDQPDSIWVTFGGIYVRIEENANNALRVDSTATTDTVSGVPIVMSADFSSSLSPSR